MIYLVSAAAGTLALVGLTDRRAHPFIALFAYLWMLTALSDLMPDRMTGLAMRVPVDLMGGVLALYLLHLFHRYEAWAYAATGVFVMMLLNHAVFWAARFNSVDTWSTYSHTLNALLILQLAILAGPGGLRGVRYARSWVGSVFDGWRGRAFVGVGEAERANRPETVRDGIGNRRFDVRPDCRLHLSSGK